MDVTKPYKFMGFGAMDATKPYEFIGFGATAEAVSRKVASTKTASTLPPAQTHARPASKGLPATKGLPQKAIIATPGAFFLLCFIILGLISAPSKRPIPEKRLPPGPTPWGSKSPPGH